MSEILRYARHSPRQLYAYSQTGGAVAFQLGLPTKESDPVIGVGGGQMFGEREWMAKLTAKRVKLPLVLS